MSEAFTRVGKEILANGYHYADGADETAAQHIVDRLTDRTAIIAYLRLGGGYDARGHWYAWDSETCGYANGFADAIEQGAHDPTPPITNQSEAEGR